MTTTDPITNGHPRARRRRPRPEPDRDWPDPAEVRAAVVRWWQTLDRLVEDIGRRLAAEREVLETAFADNELRDMGRAVAGILESTVGVSALNPLYPGATPLPPFPVG